jgi:serine/threonine protein phosphatase PrpC
VLYQPSTLHRCNTLSPPSASSHRTITMFHLTSFWNVVLPLLLLSSALPASFMTLTTPSRSYSVTTAAAVKFDEGCPPYGCPLFPLDVISSETARAGLEFLRKQHEEEGTRDPNNYSYYRTMETLKSAGNEDQVTLTLMGYKGGPLSDQINQDSATIISPFYVGATAIVDTDDSQLLGIFDGHGKLGEITSNHASKEIPRILSTKLKELVQTQQVASLTALKQSIVSKAIQEAFIEADKSDPTGGVGGATATMILQLGHKIYVANAGDSRSFIGVYVDGKVHVVYVSREDKPNLPDERQRIMEAGGYVHIPLNPREDVPRAYYVNPQGRAEFGLAMSRTIGDWKVQGVIAEPIVDVLNVAALVNDGIANHTEASMHPSEIQIVAVSVSDGMIDYLSSEEIANEMGISFFEQNSRHPFVVAENLILRAAEGWDGEHYGQYRDDIALSACKVIINDKIMEDGNRAIEEEDHDEL